MTSEEYKYAVVEFIEDNEEVTVAPVPLSWFNVKTNQCVWPSNMSGVDILSRVQAGQTPDPGWPSFRGSILRKCKTFRKAKKRTTIAERLSCVESTDAGEPDEEPASTSGGTRRPPSGEETSVVLPTPLPSRLGGARAPVQAPKRKKPRRQHPESLTSEHRPLETGGTGESTGVPKDTATRFEAQLLKVVLDLRIQNEQLQQQMRETQVSVAQVLRHVVSLKHQEEQPRFGERATPQEMARPEPPELFLMPICDMEQFRAAEARLKNPADRTLLEEQLLSLGDGKTLQKVVREMVGRLLSKQVQELFSLLGYRGKSRFKDTTMCKVVIGAIKSRTEGCSLDAVEKRLSRFLSGASDREGGRANRFKKTSSVPPTLSDDEGTASAEQPAAMVESQ
ncbi:uncharacterized protein LOC115317566 [Ixodes scapularis]|uniref:uncharacterized protein LOC115317566 n=1 Tax=Ixodes scapularis TaxID=6945 RepID=UPI001A9CCF67|nr:uncharacterized protein LOC115317566 [Ixodes scapularis]